MVPRPSFAPRAWAIVLFALVAFAWPSSRVRAQGALSAIESDVDQIVRGARPSVLTVVARSEQAASGRSKPRQVTRIGTGCAVSESEVLTTASVVANASRVWVRTANRLQLEALVLGTDPISNVAVLRIPGVRLPALTFATTRPPRPGDWVIAIGTSRDSRDKSTHSLGSVASRLLDPRLALMQLTNAVYPGFSGAPVVNAHGELVGLLQGELDLSALAGLPDDTPMPAGVSFMLPEANLRPLYETLRRDRRMHYGYLGVSTKAASVESETEQGLMIPLGAQVEEVVAGSPAAAVGLRKGDLIVGFEGVQVQYPTELARWVAASPPGQGVRLVWVRDELQYRGTATLAESPSARPEWAAPLATLDGGGSGRIADLERRIERLNRELARLKNSSTDSR